MASRSKSVLGRLRSGVMIPAHPLALTSARKLDDRRQRALTRYYLAAGAGGVAVGVHTTQFEIRDAGLLRPVLELGAEEVARFERGRKEPTVRVAGVIGPTKQALGEARLAADLGYDLALVGLGGLRDASIDDLVAHIRAVGEILPVFGFYLQPSVGGRILPYEFWRRVAEIDAVQAIKIAPFNRYQTLDVVRAVAESGRLGEIALYTGNDDDIVSDLVTPYRFSAEPDAPVARIVGGLLGHWAVWTRRAFEHFKECKRVVGDGLPVPTALLELGRQITDANAAFFDPQHGFRGCIAGLHEVLRRQGLLDNLQLLDPDARLSPGQAEEIDRVYRAYPHLNDDLFIAERLDRWLA